MLYFKSVREPPVSGFVVVAEAEDIGDFIEKHGQRDTQKHE